MRVLVYGGRDFTDSVRLFAVLDRWHALRQFSVVIEGEASGADKAARTWAESRVVAVDPYPANWTDLTTPPVIIRTRRDGTRYNAAAGGIRNERMLREGRPEFGIAFPGGAGTADMTVRLRRAGVPVVEVPRG